MCLIVKNEPLLEACILSFREHVAELVIVDTGSTDGTDKIAKKYADIFENYTECNDPTTGLINNFSQARQRSFDLATQKWIMWCDADDLLEGTESLLQITQEFEANKQDLDGVSFLFPYEYSYDQEGQCTCRHYRERLFYNKQFFRWVNPVHEVVVPDEKAKISMVTREEVLYKHRRQFSTKTMESGRNLRILRKYFEKVGETDARQMYYLGLECCNVGLLDESIKLLTRYIEISGWDDERVMACLKLVDIYQMMGNFSEGLKWAFKAVQINEQWGECYFAVARMFYFLALAGGPQEYRNWERCTHFAKTGLTFPPTRTLLFVNPMERDVEIHKYLNMAFNKLGRVEDALNSANTGLLKRPNDPILLGNKKLYDAFLARNKIMEGANILKNNGNLNDEEVSLLSKIINNQQISHIKQSIEVADSPLPISSPQYSGLDIVFFIGDGVESWTPKSIKKTGIGGSETAACQMAKLLAARGNRVRVYSGCGEQGEGIYDGTEYYHSNKYQDLDCDVLVVSRRADMLSDKYNIKAKLKILWVHDIFALGATNENLLKADRIFALSNWHKQNLINTHNLHPDHIIVTRNGIDLNRFNESIPRNRFKAVNSSSPDRSWPILLECWSKIKERVPQAELHLFYGFKNWEYSANFAPGHPELIARLKAKIKEIEPLGVVYHDRVNQNQLAEEFLSAGCWIYPTWFSETSCITAMEAQAAGLRTITSSIAALNETVADRGILIDGDWLSPEYQTKFIDSVVAAMEKEDDADRLVLQDYAKEHFSWSSVASEWNNIFNNLLLELKTNPLVSYIPTPQYRTLSPIENIIEEAVEDAVIIPDVLCKLNIGCGPNVFPFDGWTNYDHEDFADHINYLKGDIGIDLIYNAYRPIAEYLRAGNHIEIKKHDVRNPFSQHTDNSVDVIYLGQMIEHINYFHEAPAFLKECYRMLKPGGVLRITTPDIELLISACVNNQMNKFVNEQPAFYKEEDTFSQLAMLIYGAAGEKCTFDHYEGHMFLYGKASMQKILMKAGFDITNIFYYYEAGISHSPILEKEVRDEGMTHSFITEAVK